jgi:hypothetical protein
MMHIKHAHWKPIFP